MVMSINPGPPSEATTRASSLISRRSIKIFFDLVRGKKRWERVVVVVFYSYMT